MYLNYNEYLNGTTIQNGEGSPLAKNNVSTNGVSHQKNLYTRSHWLDF
mgnify:CR=1 FL=1